SPDLGAFALSFVFMSACGLGGVLSIRRRTSSSRFWLADLTMQATPHRSAGPRARNESLIGFAGDANGLRAPGLLLRCNIGIFAVRYFLTATSSISTSGPGVAKPT